MSRELVEKIKALAKEIGYTNCGIATIEPFEDYRKAVEQIMARFPEADPLYAKMLKREDPRTFYPWANSIIVCVRRYGKYELPPGLAKFIGRNYLCDRRYPECPDHNMPKKMKQGLKEMGLRVGKGRTPDRAAGARAGVTRFGKNTFAYSEHGSWINIETWSVDAKLPPDEPTPEPACPENCRLCIEACPTKALVEPFVMRIDYCIAHLTYSVHEPVSPELWEKMGTWIYGCDVCQEVCPLNKGAWEPLEKAFWLEEIASHLTPEALANMDPETYQNIVHPRFWYIHLENIEQWHKNAKRALTNIEKKAGRI